MSKGKLCVITRNDDPHAYFIGLYKTAVGGCISTWSCDMLDAYRFNSIADARRFIHLRMPKTVSPYCRIKTLEPGKKRWYI